MRLLIVFDFDDTLACKKSRKKVVAGSVNDREGLLTHCQKSHKGEQEIVVEAMYKSRLIKTHQYPLALGMMRNFIFALNDNPHLIGRSVFVAVITNGYYLISSIQNFFISAYSATPLVASGIRVVSKYSVFDRGLHHDIMRGNAIDSFRQLLGKKEEQQEEQQEELNTEITVDLWSRIMPEMVYLFDDNPRNLQEAKEKGFTAINSREPAFVKNLVILANVIRAESFFRGIPNVGYDEIKSLEADDWTVI